MSKKIKTGGYFIKSFVLLIIALFGFSSSPRGGMNHFNLFDGASRANAETPDTSCGGSSSTPTEGDNSSGLPTECGGGCGSCGACGEACANCGGGSDGGCGACTSCVSDGACP